MSQNSEKVPIRNSAINNLIANTKPSDIFPPISGDPDKNHFLYKQQYSSLQTTNYGVIEIAPSESSNQEHYSPPTTRRKISTFNLVAMTAIAVGLAIVLTLTITCTSAADNTVQDNSGQVQSGRRLFQSPQSQAKSHVDIEIPQGRLRGYKKSSRDGREYFAFYKVPYAAPPLGSLRFKDPVPPSPWEGLRDNPVVAPQCIQKEKYASSSYAVGEEDCLYANIYTPRLPQNPNDQSDLLPVMVYIHGGGFNNGNGSRYGADYFMDEDVVLITFQFRLGPFGFLTTGDNVVRGNMGMKDQVQMLRWVRDNIRHFNGDPNLVTIFGNSRGGMCVGNVVMSPLSNGLFHRAISQSGAAPCLYLPDQLNEETMNGSRIMKKVGQEMGCDVTDSVKYRECLLEKDASELALIPVFYTITIEDSSEVDESTKFMPEKPFNILESGRFNKVPYMIGNVKSEFYGKAVLILAIENLTQEINERFEELNWLVEPDFDEMEKVELTKIKEFYFEGKKVTNSTEGLTMVGDLFSDRELVHCSYFAARYHAKEANSYLYWITKPSYVSYIEKTLPGFPAKELGIVHHADELQYQFLYDGYPEIPKDDPEYYEYSKHMVKLWVHFAKTGTGTMDGLEWVPVNAYGNGYANSTYWLELSDTPVLTTVLDKRMEFWDQFDPKSLKFDW